MVSAVRHLYLFMIIIPLLANANDARVIFEKEVSPWFRLHCAPCHVNHTPKVSSKNMESAYRATKENTDFNNISGSVLIAKAKDGHCGPACRTDTEPLVKALRLWALSEKQKSLGEK